jgi:hypothetical protein
VFSVTVVPAGTVRSTAAAILTRTNETVKTQIAQVGMRSGLEFLGNICNSPKKGFTVPEAGEYSAWSLRLTGHYF